MRIFTDLECMPTNLATVNIIAMNETSYFYSKQKQEKHPHSSPKTDLKSATGKASYFYIACHGEPRRTMIGVESIKACAIKMNRATQEKHTYSSPKTDFKPATGMASYFYIAYHCEPEPALSLPKSRTMIGVKSIKTFTIKMNKSTQEKHAESSPKTAFKLAASKHSIFQPHFENLCNLCNPLEIGDSEMNKEKTPPTPSPQKTPSNPRPHCMPILRNK